MAYGLKYQAGWGSSGNQQGYVYIDALDYVGAVTNLKLDWDSIAISYPFGDWNDPIMGIQAEFAIRNDLSDFYTLLPLLSAEERQYRIRIETIYPTAISLFEGFLNCDTVTQTMLHRQSIRFAASSYLYKLDNSHPVSIDTLQNMTFIDIIDEILCTSGSAFDIRVNAQIHAEGDILGTGQSLMNKNGFYTELFWEDNITRSSALVVLRTILTTFDCYIYWLDGKWYIERYEDIWAEDIDFVEYTSGVAYDPADAGDVIAITKTIQNVHSLVFTGQSQTLAIIPGLKTVKVNLEDKRLFNLCFSDLKDIAEVTTGIPAPDYRTWLYWTQSGLSWITADAGKAKGIITNSVHRLLTIPSTVPLTKGIYTSFKFTVDNSTTVMNVKFKYEVNPTSIAGWTGVWKDYTFTFHWYIRQAGGLYFITQSEEQWKLVEGNELQYLQSFDVQGSSFDTVNGSVECSFSVPMGETILIEGGNAAGTLIGDYDLVLALGIETAVNSSDTATILNAAQAWLGDVNVSSTGDNQANVIEGNVNSNFLNKKELSVALYDCESYNYKNAILMGDTLSVRTQKWGTTSGANNIVAKGVCWNTAGTPTTADSKTVDGFGTDDFESTITGLTPGTTYKVRAYFTDSLGTTVYGNELTLNARTLEIGDPHAGGIIGYILQAGDPGYDAGVMHGIIVAIQDVTPDIWMRLSDNPHTCDCAHFLIGDGDDNTAKMIAEGANMSLYAAKRCNDYVVGAYSDWFLPSGGEMAKIHYNKIAIGGLSPTWYWTSSEHAPVNFPTSWWKQALAYDFGIPANVNYTGEWWYKNNMMNVRPCRYF